MRNRHHPPKWLDRFLAWYCSDELLEEIQGDLHEAYHHRIARMGKVRARWMYFIDVLRFFKPYSFEKYSRTKQFIPMFRNYFKIASRNLIKRKAFNILNLSGLSIGISTVLLVTLYLHHEMTYDFSHPQSQNIYRLVNNYRDQTYSCMFFNDYYQSDYETQMVLLNHLNTYDEIMEACHFVPSHSPIGPNDNYYVYVGDKKLIMNNFLFTNTGHEFQRLFPQEFIEGSPSYTFSQFDRVVLTETSARLMYGKDWRDQSVISSTIRIQDEQYIVGGVIRDVPGNVHYDFTMIVYQERIPSWGAYTYFKLNPAMFVQPTIERLNAEVELYYPGYEEDVLQKGIGYVPLRQVHFTEGMLYEIKPIANKAYLATFGLVGIVILLIIWTNYANLTIAMYAGRQRELGVRKLMGARAKDVRWQILIEAVLLTLFCFPLAWLAVYSGLPYFNGLMEVQVNQSLLFHPYVFLVLGLILIFTGIVSGLYPAFIFNRKSLISLFEGKLNQVKTNRIWNFRNALLTIQFFMLVGLMSMTLIIRYQMDYIQNRELGFEKDGVMYFGINGMEKYSLLKTKLQNIPEVEEVGTGMIPGMEMYNQLTYQLKGSNEILSDGTHIYTSWGSMKVLNIESDAFSLLESQDSVLIINETAAKKLAAIKGLDPGELIGETLVTEPEWENAEFGYGQHYIIAGIIEDFDYFSLRYPSQSLILEVHKKPDWVYNSLVRLQSDDWLETVSKIEAAYLKIEQDLPFDFTFLDDHLDQLYTKERNAGILATSLTGICIVLAVMGLIGIAGFVTLSRQKEIGIRKVFGASILDILVSLNKSYVIMIGIATLLAIPVAIFLGGKWLDNFAYRISPDFSIVLVAGIFTTLLVVTVVVLQSVRSANLNPSDTLRYE